MKKKSAGLDGASILKNGELMMQSPALNSRSIPMNDIPKNEIRSLQKPGWYWINREVLTVYGKRLKAPGIAVYNVLASYANQKTQTCFPCQRSIAELIGVSRVTVNRKIRQLREFGLLNVEKMKSHCLYSLLGPDVSDKIQPCIKPDTGGVSQENTNNNNVKKIINNFDDKKTRLIPPDSFKEFRPETREDLLALDTARALNDIKSLPLYLKYARTIPESVMRQTLSWILQVPDLQIKRSRAALFNCIIKKYAKRAA